MMCPASPDNCMYADDELWPRIPLVVGDVVLCLQPDPLLAFGQEAIVTRLPFSILHHCRTPRGTHRHGCDQRRPMQHVFYMQVMGLPSECATQKERERGRDMNGQKLVQAGYDKCTSVLPIQLLFTNYRLKFKSSTKCVQLAWFGCSNLMQNQLRTYCVGYQAAQTIHRVASQSFYGMYVPCQAQLVTTVSIPPPLTKK